MAAAADPNKAEDNQQIAGYQDSKMITRLRYGHDIYPSTKPPKFVVSDRGYSAYDPKGQNKSTDIHRWAQINRFLNQFTKSVKICLHLWIH